MGVFYGIFIAILAIFFILIIRSVTTFFHEMGHALFALLFTKDKVTVYIGSYGDIKNALRIAISRFEIFFKLNILDWKVGMCTYKFNGQIWKSILITIAGPIASILVAYITFLFMNASEVNENIKFFYFIFMASALIDLMVNLYPAKNPFVMHDGTIMHSDGQQIAKLFSRSRSAHNINEFEHLYHTSQYDTLVQQGVKIIEEENPSRDIYHLVASSLIQLGEFDDAYLCYQKLDAAHKFELRDKFLIGDLCLEMGKNEEAIKWIDQYLFINFHDSKALTIRAKAKSRLTYYEDAITDFSTAIANDSLNDEAYIHRALSLIKLNEIAHAKSDIMTAKKLESKDPWFFFVDGKLLEIDGKRAQALESFKSLKSLVLNIME